MFGKILSHISLFLFKDIFIKLQDNFKNFSKVLNYIKVNENAVSYLSNILFISLFLVIVLEFIFIFLMVKLNIYFNIFSFFITIFISFTIGLMIFLVLFKFPYYLLDIKKTELDIEFENSLKHLSVICDNKLSVLDVLRIIISIEDNYLISENTKKIITNSIDDLNLKNSLLYISENTFSEIEKFFLIKLVDVLDKKDNLEDVVLNYLNEIESSRKELSEQRKSKINILFQVNIFIFLIIIILLIIVFIVPITNQTIRQLLGFIAIILPIIEFILILILYNKN
ncbi:MAG: type II secretion system F family protein [Candidatus ainarchaeum sp.]|nr:type II secretion system F family protein [Candidatus ainarchaeum sp.]